MNWFQKLFGSEAFHTEYGDLFCFGTKEGAFAYFRDIIDFARSKKLPMPIALHLVSLKKSYWMVEEYGVNFAVVMPKPEGDPPQDPYAQWQLEMCGEVNERASIRRQRPVSSDLEMANYHQEVAKRILKKRTLSK